MSLHIRTSTKILLKSSERILRHITVAMIILTLVLVFFPLLLLFRLLTWTIVVMVIKWKNRVTTYYGKLISYRDACVDEHFCDGRDIAAPPPRISVVTTMCLGEGTGGGDLSVQQLRKIFVKNVMKAKLPKPSSSCTRGHRNKKIQRYPELQQYLSTLLGFRIWKQDPNFNIASHIVEQVVKVNGGEEEDFGEHVYTKIHQELQNKPYAKNKSPWEIILIRRGAASPSKAILACRFHHILGDTNSILQLLTECLGQKTLKRSNADGAEYEFETCTQTIKFYAWFPWIHLKYAVSTLILFLGCWSHPWKMVNFRRQKFATSLVAWSVPLSIRDVKSVAKANGVSTSAVVMSVCAGAIRKCQEDVLGRNDVAVGFQLEKPGHPDFLENHGYLGILKLPTSQPCPQKRVMQCHNTIENAINSHLGKHLDLVGRMAGTVIPYPFTSYFTVNRFIPVAMIIIDGDQDGFSIGGGGDPDRGSGGSSNSTSNHHYYPCSTFEMSVGTFKGVAGVMFCASSYKDTLRIAVVANESVLETRQVEMLAANLHPELDLLKTHHKT